jgi:transcriptional regulator with XRE-family HTH domain
VALSERLRKLRKEQGLSQEAVARRADIGLRAYGELERGIAKDPHLTTLEGIASALGTTVAELVGEESEVSAAGKVSAPPETGQYDEILIPRSPLTSEAFRGVRELLVDYEDRKEYLSLSIEDGYVEAGLKQREETASPRLRPEDDEIAFPEGAVEEVIRLHRQGKLGKDDARKAIAKLTDLALEDALEEIGEYMAEIATRVK